MHSTYESFITFRGKKYPEANYGLEKFWWNKKMFRKSRTVPKKKQMGEDHLTRQGFANKNIRTGRHRTDDRVLEKRPSKLLAA